MKTSPLIIFRCLLVILSFGGGNTLRAQGTAFTYQGRLLENGAAANGTNYGMLFHVYDSATGGGSLANLGVAGVTVSNGLFTVPLDFGSIFDGAPRWLDIQVQKDGGAFTPLNPRQALTATPYAIRAADAGLASSVVAGAINTTSLADGAVTGAKIAPGAVSQLGAADGAPVNAVQVDASGLVGIGTNAPRAGLDVVATGSVVAAQVLFQVQDEIGSYTNLAGIRTMASFSNLVAAGSINDHGVTLLDVSNPQSPSILAQFRDGVGVYTNISYPYVALQSGLLVIAGYNDNAVTLISITNPAAPVKLAELRDGIGGWDGLSGAYATIISSNLLVVAGYNESAVTLADISNPAAPVSRIIMRDNQFGFNNLGTPSCLAVSGNILAIGANGDSAVTLINITNPANPVLLSSIQDGVGGYTRLGGVFGVAMSGNLLAVAAASDNTVTLVDISNPGSPVKLAELQQGRNGQLSSVFGVALSGGRLAVSSFVGVTLFDVSNPSTPRLLAEADDGLAGADYLAGATGLGFAGTNVAVAGQADNAFSLLAFPTRPAGIFSQGWVGIGTAQPQAALDVVGNVVVEQAEFFDVNAANIELGLNSVASGLRSVALGYSVRAAGDYSTALGYSTRANGDYATALGYTTAASGDYSTALGNGATASGFAAIASGSGTTASGDYSFAAGRNAQATNQGAFVWADSQISGFSSTSNNQFLVRAAGGVGININNPRGALEVNTGAGRVQFRNDGGVAPGLTVPGSGILRFRDALEIWPDETAARAGRLDIRGTNGAATISLPGSGNAFFNAGNVGIGTANPQGALLDVEGDIRVNDHVIHLRYGDDQNHGLGYRATLAGVVGGGPFLYGFNGGALGVGQPDTVALTWSWDGHVWISNDCSTTTLTLRGPGLFCGNQTRQMLNLWGTEYGIGVQANTEYFRTAANGGFAWFKGGTHNDGANNPGGGTTLMTLDNSGNLRTVTGTIASLSDRNAKTNFAAVNPHAILERVAALPIESWSYKEAPPGQRHIGPTAQDFHAAFGVGLDDKSICLVDEGGVALAAIQGLNQKLEEQRAENAELKRELVELTKLVKTMNQQLNGDAK